MEKAIEDKKGFSSIQCLCEKPIKKTHLKEKLKGLYEEVMKYADEDNGEEGEDGDKDKDEEKEEEAEVVEKSKKKDTKLEDEDEKEEIKSKSKNEKIPSDNEEKPKKSKKLKKKSSKRAKDKCCECGNDSKAMNPGCDCVFCAGCLRKYNFILIA